MADQQEWSLSKRLMSRLRVIIVVISLVVTASIAIHYGRDIPELQQRTVFDMAEDIARNMPFDKSGDELRTAINAEHDLFTRYPTAYEWYVLDGDGQLIGSSVHTAIDRAQFPPELPPPEWDAPTLRGGWEAGKTFWRDGHVRHIIAAAHSDPAGLLFNLALGEALIHIVLPLVPFSILIWISVSTIISRTLSPLESLAEQARRVHTMDDLRALDAKDAPSEVAELVMTLNHSLERLRNSIEAEKRFLQDAAHALRTPLAIVKARLELDGERVDRNSLLEEVNGLIRMSTQLLASANAERLVLRPDARADLGDLARDVVANMTPLALRAGVDLGCDETTEVVAVRADSDAISHALKNLIENALKYTPRGRTVTVHVVSQPPSILVQDEGPGIPMDKAEAIFNRHSRGKFGDGQGAGLGLSIVRRIMAAHGGTASLVPDAGPGATFRLAFPASLLTFDPAPPALEAPAKAPAGRAAA